MQLAQPLQKCIESECGISDIGSMENKANIRDTLIHAVTEYDRRESTKRGYNHNALGIYFIRVDEICADIAAGADIRAAIVAGFSGRLADACLRACGLAITSNQENKGGAWHYQPAKLNPQSLSPTF